MLRANHHRHLPLTSPALTSLKRSLFPTPNLFFSSVRKLSIFTSLHSFLPKTHLPTSLHLHSRPPMTSRFPSPKASFSSGSSDSREILVQHLLVKEDDLKLLLELQQRVSQGEDLSDLAVEYSICPSKQEGGMLGWVRKGQMVPEFEEAAFGSPLNKVVRCKTQFGWHLLQVLSEREESLLEEIQPDEFHMKMQDPNFIEEAQLIDVREPEEVSLASLPGFQVLPLRQFGSWGPDINSKFDPQKDTYVMCHHGMRSLQVAKWLQTQKAVLDSVWITVRRASGLPEALLEEAINIFLKMASDSFLLQPEAKSRGNPK